MIIFEKQVRQFQIEIYNDQPKFDFYQLNQVHGDIVLETKDYSNVELPDGDGIILNLGESLPIAIRTADCLPIFLIGESEAAVLHAGWKGLAKGIISNQKVQAIGPVQAFIGPCIHAEDYEVGADFTQNFPNSDALSHTEDRITFNLLEEAAKQIQDCYNIAPDTSLAENTYTHPQLNSWRKNKTDKRNYNILKFI